MGQRTGLWILVALLALSLRLPFVTGLPDTPDSVRLLRAVERFDPVELSPQFPGYPLAVALVRMLPGEPGMAWAFAAAVAGTLGCVALGLLFGLPAALLGAVLPFFVIESIRVGTDVLVLPLLFLALLLLTRHRCLAGGLLLGLALGVRPSCFPFAAALFVARDSRLSVLGLGVGVLAWLLPTLALLGADAYLGEGQRFLRGHFLDWGGGVTSASSTGRAAAILEGWILRPLGGAVGVALVLLGVALVFFLRERGSRFDPRAALRHPAAVGALSYAAWVLLFQNPAHARHVLPLVLLGLGWLAEKTWRLVRTAPGCRMLATGGVLVLALLASTRAAGYRRSVPPVLSSARALLSDSRFDPLLDRIYVGSDRAYYAFLGPSWDVCPVRSLREVEEDLSGLPVRPRRSWVSSFALAPGDEAPGRKVVEFSRREDLCDWGERAALYLVASEKEEGS